MSSVVITDAIEAAILIAASNIAIAMGEVTPAEAEQELSNSSIGLKTEVYATRTVEAYQALKARLLRPENSLFVERPGG